MRTSRDNKQIAKHMMKNNGAAYILLTIVMAILISIVSISPVLTFPVGILLAFLSAVLVYGLQAAYKRMLMVEKNGQNMQVGRDFFAVLINQAIPITVTHWLKYLYLVLWYILLIIPGLYKTLAYSLVDYIMIDFPDLRYNSAISASRELMRGQKFRLLVLYLRFFWWGLLIVLTFGLAYFYVKPYFTIAMIDFYEECLSRAGYSERSRPYNDSDIDSDLDQSTSDGWEESQINWDDF
ncbi:DUF975 family protein [Aerococcus kribbianus]|uniref:DUF975 family protein n=1 Tax=Aerococcus kribbianus TaxID=2999064 RepID=A0A9X3FPH9_9LACT|nr:MULTISPECIES: DUF975 family protein [unclassified Aerococcus]MCZ0717328.1 DUF975 family protein [Aerococcus sp. YH-aer221]MCZ0725616.1 DUF975 family protein [Aerococcus sp. YH-aer222]